ncbi:XdhC/CoxI family protein [Thermoflexus sp.]|uniref:XdhC/CoxI family protein n=1 Tax=Thermoflexus sp. TaxID=1969742 RepID=UPI0025DAA0FD|nr:XdhC/CoxI family protein [Thermoflexus sp.]MDW8181723.1 XdhC/CoxI family protein [Anaerolineae bacterium]MCS6964363.1 XdhC/CoxI family protein [Thermoflexus sp.]MCS7352261.1 XdhC/CoxI family protein [Thermoflexus sp.]MCX7689183.1 XdhC/CoxI family protein [Thermoflexus sp.]MDW8185893.1 XdhC/CoxI family protein [Anaerolineae bacterium]
MNWFDWVREAIRKEEPLAVATVIRGPEAWLGAKWIIDPTGDGWGGIHPELDAQIRELAQRYLAIGHSGTASLSTLEGEVEVYIEAYVPAPLLIIVGGTHIGIALASIAKILGWRVYLVDPRRTFATPERFPHVDRLIHAWPDEVLPDLITSRTAVAVLTHDPKLDDPAVIAALQSPAFYVGALGSRKTSARRRERLRRKGISEEALARLHGPIGLDIGARTPEEIALSIMAEIIAEQSRLRQVVQAAAPEEASP